MPMPPLQFASLSLRPSTSPFHPYNHFITPVTATARACSFFAAQVTPIPVPIQKKGEAPLPLPPRIEVEIRKLDKLLAASDAKIQIVTPIPGAGAKKEVAAAGAEGDKAEGGDDE